MLRVSIATVYTLCREKKIRHTRVLNSIRVEESDLAEFLALTLGQR